MGQKTHPLGFRLGITLKHKSFWFSTFKNYWKLLKEDDQIRTYFKPFLNKASISNILIYRYSITDNIDITQIIMSLVFTSCFYFPGFIHALHIMKNKKTCGSVF